MSFLKSIKIVWKKQKFLIKVKLSATLCLQKILCSINCANKLFVYTLDTKLIAEERVKGNDV